MRAVALAAGESFSVLLVIVHPFANVPMFVSLTSNMSTARRAREAWATAVSVAVVLLVFMIAGEPLLHFFGITIESLQVAGGILILVAGFQMIVGPPLAPESNRSQGSVAFTPMAIPLLAGPGAMGALAALDARDAGSSKYAGFAVGIIAVSIIVYLCMRGATWITDRLGESGIDAINRVVGLFVLAIGVEMVLHGILTHGAVTHLHKI